MTEHKPMSGEELPRINWRKLWRSYFRWSGKYLSRTGFSAPIKDCQREIRRLVDAQLRGGRK